MHEAYACTDKALDREVTVRALVSRPRSVCCALVVCMHVPALVTKTVVVWRVVRNQQKSIPLVPDLV